MNVKRTISLISYADVFTLLNGFFGLCAIASLLMNWGDIIIGMGFIVLAMVMDGIDGAAARKFGTKHSYGRHLDSIADFISFCIAPGVMLWVVYFDATMNNNLINMLTFISVSLIMLFGLLRLIKFVRIGYMLITFRGLPTPAMALLVLILSSQFNADVSLPITICGAILMVSNVKYPKIRGKTAVILVMALSIFVLSMLLRGWEEGADTSTILYQSFSYLGLGLLIGYIVLSPVIVWYRKKEMKHVRRVGVMAKKVVRKIRNNN